MQKTRVEFKTLDQARDHARQNGGWIANPVQSTDKVFWYSFDHTVTEIVYDTQFDCEIGPLSGFSDN